MKNYLVFCSIVFLIMANTAFAINCRVIEFRDHTEVICGEAVSGERAQKAGSVARVATGKRAELNDSYHRLADKISRLQKDLHRYREYADSNKYFSTSQVSAITVNANHYDVERNKQVTVNISCDVTSAGSGDVVIFIVGQSFKGEVLSDIMLKGYVEAGSYTKLSATKEIPIKRFLNIRRWEPKQTDITTKISENGDFSEMESITQLHSLILEYEALKRQMDNYQVGTEEMSSTFEPLAERISQEYNPDVARDVIQFKKGVEFSHSNHQRIVECAKCHKNGSGKIDGFGKDLAHKTCKGCHSEEKKGPTSCKGCHTK